MAATLQLVRFREGVVFELRRGTFHVLLDGNDVGSIEWKQTVEVPLEPGHHTLQLKAGRYTSPKHSFDTTDGEIVRFRCHGALLWPLYVASIVKPDLAIALKRARGSPPASPTQDAGATSSRSPTGKSSGCSSTSTPTTPTPTPPATPG